MRLETPYVLFIKAEVLETRWLNTKYYHMALSLQNYWENPRMRAVRISASRAGKSRTVLLRTRTVPCDAILGDFVAFKYPSYLQPEKQMETTLR